MNHIYGSSSSMEGTKSFSLESSIFLRTGSSLTSMLLQKTGVLLEHISLIKLFFKASSTFVPFILKAVKFCETNTSTKACGIYFSSN